MVQRGRTEARRAGRFLLLLLVSFVLLSCTPETETPAPAPVAVSISARSTAAIISWHGEANRYLVEIGETSGAAAAKELEVDRDLAVVDGLLPGHEYEVKVTALSAQGKGLTSAPVRFFTVDPEHPFPPPSVRLDSTTSTNLVVRWTSVADEVRYEVQLATSDTFEKAKKKRTTGTKQRFDKLSNKSKYYVRVRVIDQDSAEASQWSQPVSGQPLKSAPLVAGTYNILKSQDRSWSKRKPALVRTIKGEGLDVLGIQEATPARIRGVRQYTDLANALGSDWALVESSKGTGEVRILYNQTRLKVLSWGVQPIKGSAKWGGFQRYVKWAVFRQASTSKSFLFLTTHFSPRASSASDPHRADAAKQLVATMKRVNKDDLPVIVTGDFNSGSNRVQSNRVYTNLLAGGLKDPQAVPKGKLGHAETLIRANLKTVNGYSRVAPKDASAPMVDYIFVTPMRVKEWEVVAQLDRRGRFIGTIPSDHNMVRVTVELP